MTLTRSRYFLVFGQSYGYDGYNWGGSYGAFMTAVGRIIDSDAAAVQTSVSGSPTIAAGQLFQLVNESVSGSAVLAKHAGSAGYWVENDGTTAGALLTACISSLSGQTLPQSVFVYSHGEQDALSTTTAGLANEVRTGMESIFEDVRLEVNVGSPTDEPIWIDMLGPRFASSEFNEYRMRDAMIDMITAGTNLFRGAEKYAVRLDQTTHPCTDPSGYAQLGAHTGRKVAQWLEDQTELSGPSISGTVRSGAEVAITISVPGGGALVKPTEPDYIGLFDASENRIPIIDYAWDGNELTVTGTETPAKLRYPARTGRPHDIENIIRLSDPVDPIYTGEPGLPLESIKTVTF